MEKLSDMSGRNISRVQESRNSDGLGVGDLLSTKKHQPLDASRGVQIIAKKVGVVFFILLSTMNLADRIYKGKQLLVLMMGKIWDEMFQKRATHEK